MREIKLTRGKVVIVDDKDFETLSVFKWFCGSDGYAHRWLRVSEGATKHKLVHMHRVVINAPIGMDVDHKNYDKLDNRSENLRICTRSQNIARAHPHSKNGYKGIWLHKPTNKWVAHIWYGGKNHNLGCFKTASEAAMAYQNSANEIYKDYAYKNI
jgi:hypothetical protein